MNEERAGGCALRPNQQNPYTPAKILRIAKQRNYLQVCSKLSAKGNFQTKEGREMTKGKVFFNAKLSIYKIEPIIFLVQ